MSTIQAAPDDDIIIVSEPVHVTLKNMTMLEYVLRLITQRDEARAECQQLQKAVDYAIEQTHYAGCHGGMSESEAQFVHDEIVELTIEETHGTQENG